MSAVDRVLKLLAGLSLILFGRSNSSSFWVFMGSTLVIVGVLGFSPAYSLLGISTLSRRRPED